jgi:hypothetical protein
LTEDNDSDELEYLIDLNNLKSLKIEFYNLYTSLIMNAKDLKELKLFNKDIYFDEDLIESIQGSNIKRLILYDYEENDINLLREQLPNVEIKIEE